MAPIVQTFEADFTRFESAVHEADAQLKSFATDTDKIAGQLGRMTDQFSGTRVIQQATLMAEAVERVGGVSNLTAAELQRVGATAEAAIAKANALGIEVPASLENIAAASREVTAETGVMSEQFGELGTKLAGMFAVERIIEFGKELVEAGAQIEKMAEQTGMTADEVQKLQYVASQSDVGIESLVSAAQNLTLRLGKGDQGAAHALEELHISMDDFLALDSYQQLVAVSKGFEQIHSKTEQARIANELFGKQWKDIIPALKTNIDEVSASSKRMDADVTQTLDKWEKAGKKFFSDFTVMSASALVTMTELPAIIVKGSDAIKPKMEEAAESTDHFAEALERLYHTSADAQKAADDWSKGVLARWNKEADAAAAAAKKLADQQVADAENWYKAIDAIREKYTGEAAVVDAQKYAQAFNMIGDAVKQLSGKELDEFETKMQAGIEGLSREGQLTAAVADQFAALIVQIEQLKHAHDDNSAALAAAAKAAQAAAAADAAFMQANYNEAVAADQATQAFWKQRDELHKLEQQTKDAESAAKDLQGVFAGGALPTSASLTAAAYAPGSFLGFSTGQMVQSTTGSSAAYDWLQRVLQGRASGGPVDAGQGYLVGERGPELFVPNASGAIYPNGVGGGTVVQNTFHLVDTESNLARRVSDLIGRSITQARRLA